jgi:hypothetical protein
MELKCDGSRDQVYIWARQIGKGRLFYNSIGFGFNNIMAQQDSIVPKLYWQNLRYAAGDFQNGCTTPNTPGFDSAARVHVEAMCATTNLRATLAPPNLVVSRGGQRMRMEVPNGSFLARLRDIRGALIWEQTLSAETREIVMEGTIRPGVYQIEIQAAKGAIWHRLVIP